MRSDIAFSSDDSHRFLPWLIGMMVSLAALLLCFAITINGWMVERHGSYTNSFTVNIPAVDGDHPPSNDIVGKISDALSQSAGVASVSRVEDEKLKTMLVPWLGKNISAGDLPLPVVLDVVIKPGVAVDTEKLQDALAQLSPGTEVDAHEAWVAAFLSFSLAVRSLIIIFAVIIITAIGIMIAFTSRASLNLHGKTVRLLHSIGAADGYIARQFQKEAFTLTLRGAFLGCVLAGAGFWGMGMYMSSLNNTTIPSLNMNQQHFMLLLAIPFTCGLVALLTARVSVMKQLKHML